MLEALALTIVLTGTNHTIFTVEQGPASGDVCMLECDVQYDKCMEKAYFRREKIKICSGRYQHCHVKCVRQYENK